jgi:tripartite-type tricarboxylate transporter receptor subunit TctC
MHLALRRAVAFAATALLPLLPLAAGAQPFPTKPIRWVVPFTVGGPADIIARAMQPKMQENLGQSIYIDNRGGGNSNIGHELVARAAPDGYTILYVVPNVITNPLLYKISLDPFKTLAPVIQMTSQSYVMVASPNFAPRTLPEVIEAARKGKGVNCASGGGLPGFGCEWLHSMTKADFTHIQYKGNAPALTDLIGGQVDVMIDLFNTSLPMLRAGRMHAIALTSPQRGMPLPDLPVMTETLPGFVLQGWHGIMAPAGTPPAIIERLNQAARFALADPAVKKLISDNYIDVTPTSAAEFGKVLKTDWDKYSRITHDAGIQPE